MTFKKIGQFLSLGLIIYLIFLFASAVDIAATKNRALNTQLQMELTAESNVVDLRKKAQRYLESNYENRVRQSESAKKACLILGGLLLIQIGILTGEYRRRKDNGM